VYSCIRRSYHNLRPGAPRSAGGARQESREFGGAKGTGNRSESRCDKTVTKDIVVNFINIFLSRSRLNWMLRVNAGIIVEMAPYRRRPEEDRIPEAPAVGNWRLVARIVYCI
jgi:hypothetical protein